MIAKISHTKFAKWFFSIFVCTFLIGTVFAQTASETSYFNGGVKLISNNGTAGTIETQNPTIISGPSVSIWVMTCDSSGSSDSGYAQGGYRKISGNTYVNYFYEYNYDGDGTWYRKDFGTATVGSHNDYMVGCDSTTMYFKINNTSYGTVSLSSIPFDRNTIEIEGETHHTDDQCPGSVSNPVTMGNAEYKSTSNVWTSTTCTVNFSSIGTGYGGLSTMRNNISTSGSNDWEIWDSRY